MTCQEGHTQSRERGAQPLSHRTPQAGQPRRPHRVYLGPRRIILSVARRLSSILRAMRLDEAKLEELRRWG